MIPLPIPAASVHGLTRFVIAAIFSAFALACLLPAQPAENILVIIADDLGSDSFALTNDHAEASFPIVNAIESLASQGVLFRRAYACPTCSPTRASILTGRYGFRTGIGAPVSAANPLPDDEHTLPEILLAQNPDLLAASIGKWHLGGGDTGPNDLGGWPHFSGSVGGGVPDYYAWSKVINGESFANHPNYATEDNVDDALTWIAEQERTFPTRPWFLWVAFNAAHTPYQAPPAGTYTPPTPDLRDRDPDVASRPREYLEAMTEAMDRQMARLLAVVDLEETHVIFMGDNGTAGRAVQPPYTQDHAKGSIYEGGVRVPLIVAGPAVVSPNRVSDALVDCVDLFATILDLAGVDPSTALEGVTIDSRSFLPLLADPAVITHRGAIYSEAFGESLNPDSVGRALCDGRYKLIQFERGTEEFYDLDNDTNEENDLLPTGLSTEEMARYTLLASKIELLINGYPAPEVSRLTVAGSQITIAVPEVMGLETGLQRSFDLTTWEDTGISPEIVGGEVVFTVENPSDTEQFFLRITAGIEGM